MRLAARAGLLTALWLLAWGEVSAANIVSGIAVAAGILVAFPPSTPGPARVHVRPLAALRLAGYVASQLVSSNVVMTREILARHSSVRPGILEHRLRQPSEHLVTVMTSIIALSPGTMTADVDPESTTIYVHFLFLRDVDAARRGLERLELLASQAIQDRPRRSGVT